MQDFFIEHIFGGCIDFVIYVALVGGFCVPVFAIAYLIATLVPPGTLAVRMRRGGKIVIFGVLFVLVGALFNFVWGLVIWGNLYYSTDYCGTDCLPFWPITQARIDAPFANERGQLFSVTLGQLQFIWLLFQLSIWGTTLLIYRSVNARWVSKIESVFSGGT